MRESDKSSDKMRRKRVSSAFSLFNLLEKDLGLKLFIRTHRGLVLTEAGKSLYTTRIYAVEVFSKGRENDSQPGKDAEEYAEYCEAAGWQLIDGRRRFCIFRRVQDDAVPIVTEEERFQNVKKAEIRHFLDRSAGFALLAGLDWLQFFTINFDRWVFSQTWLLLLAGLTFMCLFYLLQLGGLFVWSRRAKRELESRGSIYYGQRKSVRAANEIWTLVIMGLLIYCAGDIMSRDSIIMLIIAVMIVFGVRIVMIYMRPSWEAQIAVWTLIPYCFIIIFVAGIVSDVIQMEEGDYDFSDVPLVQSDYREMGGERKLPRNV